MASAAVVFLTGVLAGGIAGGAAGAFVAAERSAPPSDPSAADARFERIAETIDRAVTRAIREARAVQPRRTAADEAAPAPEAVAPAGPAGAAAPSTDAPAPSLSRPRGERLPPKRTERIQRMVVRSDDDEEALRRDWLFLSEETVLTELGAPDVVEPGGSGERWVYFAAVVKPSGVRETQNVVVDFARGRVVAVYGLNER